MKQFNFRLDEQTHADILAMAEHVGKPGQLTAGAVAIFAQWRRWKAAQTARQEQAAQAVERIIAQHEEYCDALEQRAEAEGR